MTIVGMDPVPNHSRVGHMLMEFRVGGDVQDRDRDTPDLSARDELRCEEIHLS